MLKDKSKNLLDGAEHTLKSGEEGTASVKELKEHNRQMETSIGSSFEKIKVLQQQSEKIAGIVGTIQNIASETELLALNASIEAARAGEQGRGFSVVAESIGRLAADSSRATADIDAIIKEFCSGLGGIVSRMEDVRNSASVQMEAVRKTGDIFLEFKQMAQQTGNCAGDMDRFIGEMYETSRLIADAAQRIHDISQKAEELSGEAAASLNGELKDIRDSVNRIVKVSDGMELEMGKFRLEDGAGIS